MNDALTQIWLAVQWFFGDFCLRVFTAPVGLLKDTIDTIEITWQLACLGASILSLGIGIAIQYLKNRL